MQTSEHIAEELRLKADNGPAPKPLTAESSWNAYDRMDWQLFMLAIALIVVLAAGVLSLMFPAVFWSGSALPFRVPDRFFYGLCTLIVLSLAYMVQQQTKVRGMKQMLLAERRERELELLHQALHDTLTGLPNRELLTDRISLCLASAKRNPKDHFAVLLIGLDRFKVINESLGHAVGDKVLAGVAERLVDSFREEDTVARLGADEFAILLQEVDDVADILRPVERIRNQFNSPLLVDGRELFVSASIGVTLSSTGYEHPEDLLRDADSALYRAKAQGTGQYEVFNPAMHALSVKLLTMDGALRKAIERRELVPYYQPIVCLRDGRVVGFEALVRWRHPERGMLMPAEFLPVAEAASLMFPLTRSLLQQVCRQIQTWREAYPGAQALTVSINVSARSLTREDQVREMIATIQRHAPRQHGIKIEVTESQLMERTGFVEEALQLMRAAGIQVYIDDFGTGYSSLGYLSQFKLDALKIDQSFIRNLQGPNPDGAPDAAIVRSVISLGHHLAMDVIAEGIETQEQFDYLRAVRCEFGQGYLMARPMPAHEVTARLGEWFPESRNSQALEARLRAFPLFAGMDTEELSEIAHIAEEVAAGPGDLIIREGQLGDAVYFVDAGAVAIYHGNEFVDERSLKLQAPTLFGEMALFNIEGTRTANVRAVSDLKLLRLPSIRLRSLVRRIPKLQEGLRQLAAERVPTH